MSLLPLPEAIYPDLEAVFTVIQLYTKGQGYAFKKREKRSNRVVFTCDRAGKYNPKGKDPAVYKSKQYKATGSKMCGYLMIVELWLDNLSGNWILKVLEGVHNYIVSIYITAHSVYRNSTLTIEIRTQISVLVQSSLNPSQILTVLRNSTPEIPLVVKDISNTIQEARLTELNGRTPIQWLLEVRYLYYLTTLLTL